MAAQDTSFHHRTTLNCRGRLLDLGTPVVMGILNITPDSFHDGGRYISINEAVEQAISMSEAGAGIIDIGGASSRPGAPTVPLDEEMERVLPVIRALLESKPDLLLSVDTWRAEVAEQTLKAGACIINDISAGRSDERILDVVAAAKAPYICMHMQGDPGSMQDKPSYEHVVKEVTAFFSERLAVLSGKGINDVVIDPGFGFGKTLEHNYQLLSSLKHLKILGSPVLAGLSRKSMIHRLLDIHSSEALNGTTALHMVALQNGASILRAHDVTEAVECVRLHMALEENEMN